MTFVLSDNNYTIMAVSRGFTGLFQVFITILGPIWCDAHAPAAEKTTWITWFIVATPVGIVVGYLKIAVILSLDSDWAYGFYAQVALLVPIACYVAIIDSKLLSLTVEAKSEEN